MRRRVFLYRASVATAAAAVGIYGGGSVEQSGARLRLHLVHLPIHSYRLLAMAMDQDGDIWFGSIHRAFHRYTPSTGAVETIALPPTRQQLWVSACLAADKKVYILGQKYPRLVVYHRRSKKLLEAPYPSSAPDVWYGLVHPHGRRLYLFDRGTAGVIRWDVETERGTVIPYPYQTPLPSFGRYEPRDRAIWCGIWDYTGGQYVPIALTRLDLATDSFSGIWYFPNDDSGLRPYADADTTLFYPWSLKGKIRPFDFQQKRWCRFLNVPGHGSEFGFLGLSASYQGRLYYSLSTYNGDEALGCDGKPYHFLNALLEFDPASGSFNFLRLIVPGAYYQIAYTLVAQGEFYATGSNIQEKDGTLNRERRGDIVVWQSHAPRPAPPGNRGGQPTDNSSL